jgi:adenylate cyclase
MIDITRILGRGFSQAAEAMRAMVLKLVLEPGASEHELARHYVERVAELMPLTEPMLGQMLTLHLRHMVQTYAIGAVEREAGQVPGAREVTVAFADLVGYTRVGEEVAADELGRIAGRLAEMTSEVVRPPVRLVKTIGDAAMLTSPTPAQLLEGALDLVDAADAEGSDFPQLRVGVACGQAVSRAGDWYGHPVNLASRVTDIARPGSVLVTNEIRDSLEDSFAWSFAGARRLKGIREPVPLFRARRTPQIVQEG